MINSYICFVGPVSSPSGANIGAIVGGTLGGIVFAVILVLGMIYIIRKTATKEKEDPYLNPIPHVADMTTFSVTNNGYTNTHRDLLESSDSSAHYNIPTH